MNLEFNHSQKLVYNYLKDTFDISNIEGLFYIGLIAGSEFLTYNVKKLYFGLNVNFSQTGTEQVGSSEVTFYDEANLAMYTERNGMELYDSVSPYLHFANNTNTENIYFSRVSVIELMSMKFIGYRITLV